MRFRLSIAALAGAALLTAGAIVAIPQAQAATQTVAVDCATSSAADFTMSPGDEIVFELNAVCKGIITGLGGVNLPTFQGLVNKMYVNATGGSAVAAISGGGDYSVTYTAGSNPGTDTLDVSQTAMTRSVTSNDYSMTVPGGVPTWLQAYARASGDTCETGWSPSWAEWPHGGTGGFVCVRSLVYNYSTGKFDARRLLKQQHVIESLR